MDTSNLLSTPEESPRGCRQWRNYLSLITVEPTMFLYMLAFMFTSVVEQAFFVHKACKVDYGYNDSICANLSGNSTENTNVQLTISTFHQWNDIASNIIPIFLAPFIGAWCDRRGRKLLLLMGLAGKLWYSVWIVINATQDTWPVYTSLWTASFPSGLTGADLAIFAACFSYISDISSEEDRTFRVTILDFTYLIAIPVGVAIGNAVFHSIANQSYAVMFAVNAVLLFLNFLYSLFRLDWTTLPTQKTLRPCGCSGDDEKCCLLDFFDINHLIQSIKTVLKRRPHHGRTIIFLMIISLALYTFQRDERQMSYLYTVYKFEWDVNLFSNFRTFQSAFYVVGTFFWLVLSRWRRPSDITMILVGTTAHAVARVIFIFAKEPWLFYLGSGISSLGPVVAPVIRSIASKIVPLEERGKMFAVLSISDTAVPLFSGVVYSQVYNATIDYYPSAIYWVTVATQMSVFFAALFIKLITRGHKLEECASSISTSS